MKIREFHSTNNVEEAVLYSELPRESYCQNTVQIGGKVGEHCCYTIPESDLFLCITLRIEKDMEQDLVTLSVHRKHMRKFC